MNEQIKNYKELLELANNYPSPHNGQPIRVKKTSDIEFELYFEKQRGLQATDISFIFSFVSMGVFVEHIKLSAIALGHRIAVELKLPNESELKGEGLVIFAKAKIDWNVAAPKQDLLSAIKFRQTSRKKYYEGIPEEISQNVSNIAGQANMSLVQLNKRQTKQAIWLNQRAVFDDMFDEPVRLELDHWLRYDQTEKQLKKDGLAYDCMELNGKVIKYIVDHPGLLRAKGLDWLIKQYYLRTMSDNSNVFYMMAPFRTGIEAYKVGEVVMKVWQVFSESGYYLHPFGTIMSNHKAHHDFLDLVNVHNESLEESYLVLIFRAGKSKTPVRSLRIPINEHLILE